ncbi:hypothetical protein GCM10009416_49270 [Craurococcus roseus]|uniref:O-antigen polymerase n=1 Tax=Craurococcus roseus TaxID=77585 RepID=A0ABP3REU1_9PROT
MVAVVALSILAIFSTQLFEGVADTAYLDGFSANGLSLGRYELAIKLWDEMESGSLLNRMVGFGPAAADTMLESYAVLEGSEVNPHNDWLKILFDYGMAGFVAMHVVLFLNLARHRLGLMLYLYTASAMVTDNVLIYMFYHPFIALVMCAERGREKDAAGFRRPVQKRFQ